MAPNSGKKLLLFAGFLLLLLQTACTMAGKPSMGEDLQGDAAKLPSSLLLLPIDVSIEEISAGGVMQEDPQWSKEGEEALVAAVKNYFAGGSPTSLVAMPELTAEESERVHEHILLYDVVAKEAYIATTVPGMGWEHLAKNFHYTLGDGLRFLKQKTGAEAALIVIGSDAISTGGRKAMVAVAALLGVGMPVGRSNVLVGVIDLEDGDILWFRHSFAEGNRDLRNPEDAGVLFAKAMEGYGGK
jgi:hypothetical protein